MNRNRLILIGIASLIVAGLLSLIMYRNSLAKLAEVQSRTTKVVVASSDLALGAMIDAKDVQLADMPKATLPDGAFSKLEDVVGRGVIAPMAKNEIVLPTKIAAKNAGAGLPAIIPSNMRAVSVRVNDVVSVAGFVTPGTRVDVLVTGSPNQNQQDTVTTTVLENVEVLAAGQKIQANAEGKPENVTVITLLVTPDDAQKLTLASTEGKIQLALRNVLDGKKENSAPVSKGALYRVGAAPRPAPEVKRPPKVVVAAKQPEPPPPLPVYSVEVLRGDKPDKRDVQKF